MACGNNEFLVIPHNIVQVIIRTISPANLLGAFLSWLFTCAMNKTIIHRIINTLCNSYQFATLTYRMIVLIALAMVRCGYHLQKPPVSQRTLLWKSNRKFFRIEFKISEFFQNQILWMSLDSKRLCLMCIKRSIEGVKSAKYLGAVISRGLVMTH